MVYFGLEMKFQELRLFGFLTLTLRNFKVKKMKRTRHSSRGKSSAGAILMKFGTLSLFLTRNRIEKIRKTTPWGSYWGSKVHRQLKKLFWMDFWFLVKNRPNAAQKNPPGRNFPFTYYCASYFPWNLKILSW
jgi:hypothetical protein